MLGVTWALLPSLEVGWVTIHVLPRWWCPVSPGLAVFGLYICLAFHLLQEILVFLGLAICDQGVCPGKCGQVSIPLG